MKSYFIYNKIFKPTTISLLIAIILMFGLITAYLRPWWKIGGDGFGYYAYLRSTVYDKNLNFTNELTFFDQEYNVNTLKFWRTPLGKAGSPFAIGASILWSPFFAGALATQDIFHFNDPYPLPGYNLPFQIALGLGTWFYVLFGAALLYQALKKFFSDGISWLATMAIFLVTALPYYLVYEPSMAHGLTFFTTSLLFYLFVKIYKAEPIHWRWSVLIGLAVGLVFLVRWQDVLFGIIPLVLIIGRTIRTKWYQHVLIILLTSFIVAIPQLLIWKSLYGSYITIPQTNSFFQFNQPHFFQFLFSGYHGLFIIHPLLILAVLGLGLALKRNKLLIALLLISLVLQIFINSSLYDWYGGASFGARRMISASFIFCFGFAYFFSLIRGRKIWIFIFASIFILGAFFNLLLSGSYARKIIPLNAPTSINQIYSAPIKLLKSI